MIQKAASVGRAAVQLLASDLDGLDRRARRVAKGDDIVLVRQQDVEHTDEEPGLIGRLTDPVCLYAVRSRNDASGRLVAM